MVILQDVVPYSLILALWAKARRAWGAQNHRHAAEVSALHAHLRHVRVLFLTGMIALCDDGPPESTQAREFLDWPSGHVPNHLRDLRYDHTEVVEALLDAIILKLFDYDPEPEHARGRILKSLKEHVEAPHTPERVTLELKQVCLTPPLSLRWWTRADTRKIEWMVWAAQALRALARRANVFLRTLAGTCPPVCPSMGSGLRFTDNYFQDQ